MKKVYVVLYEFKDEKEYDLYYMNEDNHPTFNWLSNGPIKAVGAEDVMLDNGNYGVEIYFEKKKDAKQFSLQFNIKEKIESAEMDFSNPWLPEGMDYDSCMKIYGAIPGDR